MRKIILHTFFFLLVTLTIQSQDSVLSDGTWYKFSIDTTGVFKIDTNFLQDLGVSINDVDPRNIKIYGNGGALLSENISESRYDSLQENHIYIKGEGDGVFDNDDYILFYGQGPHSWDVNENSNPDGHIQNIYSDKAFYFLTISDSQGKRITSSTEVRGASSLIVTSYNDYVFYEKEETNIAGLGRLWFGENLSVENTQSFSIPFNNVLLNSSLTVKVTGAVASNVSSIMNVTVNDVSSSISYGRSTLSGSNIGGFAKYGTSTSTVSSSGDNVNVTIAYNNNGNPSARAYVDYIEVYGEKQLIATGSQFAFRSFEVANTNGIVEYKVENQNNIYQVWDITNPLIISRITNQSTSTDFVFFENGGELKEYVVLNENDYYTPEQIDDKLVSNQNLKALEDITYLVITSEELSGQAQRLADYHQNNSNLTTKVVLLSEIYNEFSSGAPDITGIRDFIKSLHDKSSSENTLKYVCFFGDSSYDYKDRLTGNNNVVPTYHAESSFDDINSYVTDDYYVMIENDDGGMNGNDTIDIASGRIPVTTIDEASKVVDKILNYYNKDTFGDWRHNITLIADDIDNVNSDNELQSDLEKVADSITKYKPNFNINKIYADAFQQQNTAGGERYPAVNEAIVNSMEQGALVFDYFGHGGEDALGEERFLETTGITGFNNFDTLPLFITVTCEFSRFDNPLRDTAGEALFLNENGGAVSMITTTRAVFISFGDQFNVTLAKYVFDFNNENETIAQGLMRAKNTTTSNQRYFIYFFGDPAMRLAIPEPDINITKMNGIDVTQSRDTIKALSKISLEGNVTQNNNVLSNFNGVISTTIYDKIINKETLDNDGAGIVNVFDTQESKIFKGKSSVKNGVFQLEFIVPKDIKIAYGKSKISMYAQDEESEEDKGGSNFDILVGGINENASEDSIGPEIQAFMNDESFIEGGQTNTSPNLILKLFDASGINTSLTAVDHDIVAILDGNQSDPIVLNDYYETALDDFTNGEVNYQLRNLEEGEHTLAIKVWDTYNNSSEVTLTFLVVSDLGLNLTNVLNYPNPFVNYTEFWFNHNKPNSPLEVQVQIFTVSGKLIKTLNESVQTNGGLSRSISWNGLDDFGNKIGKGVYVYKLKVTDVTDNLTSEKYEKLVILQ